MILKTSRIGELDSVSLTTPGYAEHYITAHPNGDGTSFSMFENVAKQLRETNATIIGQYVFGGCEFHEEGMQALERACGPVTWPVTWLQGDQCSGTHLTGTQVFAVSGVDVQPIRIDDQDVGSVFEHEGVKYCMLGNIHSSSMKASRKEQTRETFERMEETLRAVGMEFSDIVRTWIYLDDLLEWYDDFNEVRTQFFKERGVFEKMVPASTGIGTSNHADLALVTGLLAIKPAEDSVTIQAVPSPLQCPAIDYKSSFSRAVEVKTPSHKRLYISGTASIEPGGETVHLDDTMKQVALTMEVVQAILESRGMDWSDTTRAIAYFKDDAEAPLLQAYCQENDLPHFPVAIAHSDVCRHDLLFELELDAMVTFGAA
ncbi:MAG: endoribonuclease L-PSP [Kiritimatiellae bacterium]|nr:endoribonuclease L-PSP [Kiritimatiellia bacterium]